MTLLSSLSNEKSAASCRSHRFLVAVQRVMSWLAYSERNADLQAASDVCRTAFVLNSLERSIPLVSIGVNSCDPRWRSRLAQWHVH